MQPNVTGWDGLPLGPLSFFDPLDWLSSPFAVIDTETTGPDPETCRIVQVAAALQDYGELTSEHVMVVDPEVPIPKDASRVHGITDDTVRGRPTFMAIASKLVERLQGRILVGYNLATFDMVILRRELALAGLDPADLPTRYVDVLALIRHYDRFAKGQGRHRLGVAADRWGCPPQRAHHALGDVRRTWELFRRIVGRRIAKHGDFFGSYEDFAAWQSQIEMEDRARFAEWKAKNGA